jgi:hypothetical protein
LLAVFDRTVLHCGKKVFLTGIPDCENDGIVTGKKRPFAKSNKRPMLLVATVIPHLRIGASRGRE